MWEFYKEVLKKFKDIGAFTPSWPLLAKAMAQALPKPFHGTLIELGPGTGAITKGLLKKGISANQIIAVEHSKTFAEYMKTHYPEINIVEGNAEQLSQLIAPFNKNINAIVSSLPLRNFSEKKVSILLNEIDKVLMPGGYYIQYTYGKKINPIMHMKNFTHIQSKRVLLNLPPARVDVFEKKQNLN